MLRYTEGFLRAETLSKDEDREEKLRAQWHLALSADMEMFRTFVSMNDFYQYTQEKGYMPREVKESAFLASI